MRLLHFSDFHLNNNTLLKDGLFTIEPFLQSLNTLNNDQPIDLVVFSGDLIDQGGRSFKSAEEAFMSFYDNVIRKVCHKLNLGDDKFIICPGNHDIVRNLDSEITESGCLNTLTSTSKVNSFIRDIRNGGDMSGVKRIVPYKDFLDVLYTPSENLVVSYFESGFKYKIDNRKIGIIAFNSSWRCFGDNDKGNLLIGEDQLINGIKYIKDCDYKIAVIHHFIDQLTDTDKLLSEKLLQSEFDMLLCGHVHSASNKYVIEPQGKLLTLIAPGTLSVNVDTDSKKYSNGFSIIDLNFLDAKMSIKFYSYNFPNPEFNLNTSLGKEGIWAIDLPKSEAIEKEIERQNLIKTINEEHVCKMDMHMLTYSTDTDAPKSLMELFVQPKLTLKASINSDKEETIEDILSIINNKENYLLFGTKESGKTILLDKLICECLNPLNNVTYIPVYIEFSKIASDLVSNIRDYLLVSKEATKAILSTHPILLLVDNLKTSNEFVDLVKIKQLFDLTDEFPNLKIIATYTILYGNEIPEHYTSLDKFKFNTVTIKDFQSKQIRDLTTKWFKDKNLIDKPQKVETLINGFLSLSLPRTPFTVSMFLWIIEKQQNYKPINNSTLIENFIEKLLNKHSKTGILSETFDYQNKVRLLSEIAYKMLKEDGENYSDTHANVFQFISFYLKKKDFSYNVEKILNELIECGIFVKDDNFIRFRFTCFLEYFLVKKMGYDSKFKEEVLDENNYLKYINEIDYFTGLNRDDADILKLIVNRSNIAFKETKEKIQALGHSLDDFFKQSVSQIKIPKNDVTSLVSDYKATEEDLIDMDDAKLLSQKAESGIQKKGKDSAPEAIAKSFILSLKVLKNSEEVEEQNLKLNSLKYILDNSVYFAIFYKIFVSQLIEKKLVPEKEKEEQIQILQFLPWYHETLMNDNMGTQKLSQTLYRKIQEDKSNETISEFEKFLSVFLYADVRGQNYFDVLDEYIKSTNKKYILDMSFIKIMNYYNIRSKDPDSDLKYLNMIGDILIKAKGYSKEDKGKLMEKYKTKKPNKDS
ncbi:metallophosphoesterase [Mucilaginibacter aquariorum]|uniref:Metallophosphoesterase n=1 Tax=Mucilaginibacter aquariorum TaxID=2967225 RepID=A0ABT1T5K0_9SPHI|nr:metallophosphoesterase [Mucilaginibacter aquariorum]MCQ6959905.1 metallophosphoesterase [Mucilaginibacter aquariorum]